MQDENSKRLSEFICVSRDLTVSFREVIPKLITLVRSEILSNPKFYSLIGNNSMKFLEEALEQEAKIILLSMEIDSFKFLKKQISRLYSICIKRGFQEEFFKVKYLSWINALPSVLFDYSEEIKKICFYINENFMQIISYVDSVPSQYEYPEGYEEFLRSFISKLYDGDSTEAEILLKTFVVDNAKKEKVYETIFYPAIDTIRNLYDSGYTDEMETVLAFSTINRALSSIYNEGEIQHTPACYSIFLPVENLIGERVWNLYNKMEAQIFSDILSSNGVMSFPINANEIFDKNFEHEKCFACFFRVSAYNFNQFRNFVETIRAKSASCRILIFSEDMEGYDELKNYGSIVNSLKEALEVIRNA